MAAEPIVVPHKRRNLHGLFGFYIRRSGGRYPQPYLCVLGSAQVGIAMNMFDKDEIVRACETKGWRFVNPYAKG